MNETLCARRCEMIEAMAGGSSVSAVTKQAGVYRETPSPAPNSTTSPPSLRLHATTFPTGKRLTGGPTCHRTKTAQFCTILHKANLSRSAALPRCLSRPTTPVLSI
jgi:hypothetical protein